MATELQKIIDHALAESGCADHPCEVLGHEWKHIGGRNACCDHAGDACGCSVPVHDCDHCGDCDYGENDEARATIAQCKDRALEPLTYVQP